MTYSSKLLEGPNAFFTSGQTVKPALRVGQKEEAADQKNHEQKSQCVRSKRDEDERIRRGQETYSLHRQRLANRGLVTRSLTGHVQLWPAEGDNRKNAMQCSTQLCLVPAA